MLWHMDCYNLVGSKSNIRYFFHDCESYLFFLLSIVNFCTAREPSVHAVPFFTFLCHYFGVHHL